MNYNDERFAQVEAEKQAQLSNVTNTYNTMINDSQSYYDKLAQETKDYANKQTELQQANTDFAIEKINQDKAQAEKDYNKEQGASYVDYQKQMASNTRNMMNSGLANTGYSESSQVSMYNTYQNRVATARETYNKALLNYNNSIKEAQLANNSALAQIAHDALQQQLQLSLQGFQYKNELTLDLMNKQQAVNDTYYNRYKDVVNQINTENAFNESKRQWEAEMAYKKERDAIADAQWQQTFDLNSSKKASSGSKSSGKATNNNTAGEPVKGGLLDSAKAAAGTILSSITIPKDIKGNDNKVAEYIANQASKYNLKESDINILLKSLGYNK